MVKAGIRVIDMAKERDAAGHLADTSKVQFWVKTPLLEKWDDFCEKHSLNRTAFLTQAANDYMLTHNLISRKEDELANLENNYKMLQDQMAKVLELMVDKKAKNENALHDPDIRARISSYLLKHGWSKSDVLYPIIGLDHEQLLDVLVQMKKDGILITNKTAEWNIKK